MDMHRFYINAVLVVTTLFATGFASWHLLANEVDAETPWVSQTSSDGSTATARHEAGAVSVGDKFYLIGGRSNRPMDIYDTVTRRWVTLERSPVDIHHFQPVTIGTDIYALGAQVGGGYPDEPSEPDIYVYDTTSDTWTKKGAIPEDRQRGASGAVARDGIIYLVGGNTKGHNGGAIPWLDSYDPVTEEWTRLADAPNARDHFTAVIINDKLIVTGGRQSTNEDGDVFANTVAGTDIYDFDTETWSNGADIPTMRAGALTAGAGSEVFVAGGERSDSDVALSVVEAYNVEQDKWRTLQSMINARHSGGSAIIGTQWHVVAGSKTRGGGSVNETSNHETLELDIATDSDNDGLSDSEESSIYNTDPDDPDTDDDELNDGAEVDLGTDPLVKDTDGDGLFDGAEVNTYLSNPLLVDTDDDGLDDAAEVLDWQSDPNLADTDGDTLTDGDEVERMLSPVKADTDEDGLDDGAEIVAGTDPLNEDSDGDGLLDGEDPDPLVADTSNTDTGTNTDAGTDTNTGSGTDMGTGPDADTGSGTDTNTGTDVNTGSSVDTTSDADSDTDSDSDNDVEQSTTTASSSGSKSGLLSAWLLFVFGAAVLVRLGIVHREP